MDKHNKFAGAIFRKRRIAGFTLIELLVVIAIIGILTTIAVVNFSSAQVRARDSKRISDINNIAGAVELYRADQKKYPGSAVWPNSDGWESHQSSGSNNWSIFTSEINSFMVSVPPDPVNTSIYHYGAARMNWATSDLSRTADQKLSDSACNDHFVVWAIMESGTTPTGTTQETCAGPGFAGWGTHHFVILGQY